MKNLNLGTELSGLGGLGVLGLIGMGIYAVVKTVQLDKLAKKLDMSLEELEKKTPVEVEQGVVDKAIDAAVTREVRREVRETSKRVGDDIRKDMDTQVRAAVKEQYDDISDQVTAKIAEEVANINEAALQKKVEKRAEEMVIRKLDHSTDGAIAKMNNGLASIVGIYNGMGKAISNVTGAHNNTPLFPLG